MTQAQWLMLHKLEQNKNPNPYGPHIYEVGSVVTAFRLQKMGKVLITPSIFRGESKAYWRIRIKPE